MSNLTNSYSKMAQVYIYEKAYNTTYNDLLELYKAHDDLSYTCNIEDKKLIIIIAESVDKKKVPFKFNKALINSEDIVDILAFYVNSDNYTFGKRKEQEDEIVNCDYINPNESLFDTNLVMSLNKIINVYGDCSKYYYYDILKEIKSNKHLKDVTYSCFHIEKFNRMLRYFKPEKHNFLIIRGIKRGKISADFYNFLNDIAYNEIVINSVKYKGWKGAVFLISDRKIIQDGIKYKELDGGVYKPSIKMNEYEITSSVLDYNDLKLTSLGIKNPMLAEILTISELDPEYIFPNN